MLRPNPGPFEPFVYFLQKPGSFRIVGLGGLGIFTVVFLSYAAGAGFGYFLTGVVLAGILWVETSLDACRRCRFYGSWHCLGQGTAVSRLFGRVTTPLNEAAARLHGGLVAAYLLYGLFWLWHQPLVGLIFTLWVPAFLISATPAQGFSWKKLPASKPRP